MLISRERLAALSSETGFETRILEKVMRLYGILNAFQDHPFLEGKFSLKGGTVINLFLSSIPRLSVDIDPNYVGSLDKEIMLADRPQIERVIEAVLGREDLRVTHRPVEYAGGKWRLMWLMCVGHCSACTYKPGRIQRKDSKA